jgi:hypothetical protein
MELSLPSFETRDSYGDSSWIDLERLATQEKQTNPKVIFGIVGEVDYMPRNSDVSMCKLTPMSGPQSKKRYRTTPHPGDRIVAATPSPSPLAKKGPDNVAPPWRSRTRSGKKVMPPLGSSLSHPPRRNRHAKVAQVPQVPPLLPSQPSLLKQAPKRKANVKGPLPTHPASLDEPLSIKDKIELSYKEFAPHIPFETGSSVEGEFNIFRVATTDKRAILTTRMIQELLQGAKEIAQEIWFSPILDDSTLRMWLGGDGKDFLDLPQIGSRVMDVKSQISEKIDANTESAALLRFFEYCVLRVEDVTTGGNIALRKDLGRYKQDVAMLYESLLGIFCRLGPALHGRQLSLLNSLCKF